MPLADYAHWNEEAPRIWWEEEGKHHGDPQESDFDDRYLAYGRADAYAEELAEIDDDVELMDMLGDDRLSSEQHALVKRELNSRGFGIK